MERREYHEQSDLESLITARAKLYTDVKSLFEDGFHLFRGVAAQQVPLETASFLRARFGKQIKRRVGEHISMFVSPNLKENVGELNLGGFLYLDLGDNELYTTPKLERDSSESPSIYKNPQDDEYWFDSWAEIIAAVNSLPIN